MIPNDPQPPDQASGIRVGASAISARGLETDEARRIVGLIDAALNSAGRQEVLKHVASEVAVICSNFLVEIPAGGEKMKIIVIGGNGTIGKKVSQHFLKKTRPHNWWMKFRRYRS